MNIVAYFVALIALMLALNNRHSINEIRNHYNKLYKDILAWLLHVADEAATYIEGC